MPLTYSDLYNSAARWAGDVTTAGTARARDAVVFAIRELSYGLQPPPLRPWWRKREDTITPVAGTQTYAFPTAQGTMESLHHVWYRTNGMRQFIDIADDQRWADEANEDTTERGAPDICNLHQSSGTVNLRFSITPDTAFINALAGGVIRLDFFILDALAGSLITDGSQDSTAPLMPDSRRPGIMWKAVEYLAARQGDTKLQGWASGMGKVYYDMILADDLTRTGTEQRTMAPIERPGDVAAQGRLTDYGRVIAR